MTTNLIEAAKRGTKQVSAMFPDVKPRIAPMPDISREEMWEYICQLETRLAPKVVYPKVEACVKVLVEDQSLAILPINVLAEIVRVVFAQAGVQCKCSTASVRWYISQNQRNWAIIQRRKM